MGREPSSVLERTQGSGFRWSGEPLRMRLAWVRLSKIAYYLVDNVMYMMLSRCKHCRQHQSGKTAFGFGGCACYSSRRQMARPGAPMASMPSVAGLEAGTVRAAELDGSRLPSSSGPLVLPVTIGLLGTVS